MTEPASRTIAVTGAASGIGLALVRRLLARGEEVVAIDRAACPAPVTRTVITDLTDPNGLRAALAPVHGPVHGLANVAGVPGTAPARTVLEVNVLGTRLVTEALRPRLAAGSSVVNVASVAAHRDTVGEPALTELLAAEDAGEVEAWLARYPLTGAQAYDTSKAALVAWTKRLAGAWIGEGVRVTSVSPGPISTPILGDFRASMGAGRIDGAAALVGRHGTADEIAAVVAFLLSRDASWVNGVDLLVEGGLYAARAALSSHEAKGTR
jgi:NAD(P)-dependent dehydrogenase (short-subunit alcohol dehydrogenase family)